MIAGIIGFLIGVVFMLVVWQLANYIFKNKIDRHIKRGEALNSIGNELQAKKEAINKELTQLMITYKIIE